MARGFLMSAVPLLVMSAAAAAAAATGTLHSTEHYQVKYREWIEQYNVDMDPTDLEARLPIFAENSDFIERHNTANDGSTYTLGHNEFSHLTWEEFRSTHLGYKPRAKPSPEVETKAEEFTADAPAAQYRRNLASLAGPPESVDWAADGAVTPVQNQGMCGSCWAFSAIGAMEGAFFMETGELMKFSEEQLVDCDKSDSGCLGGDMGMAFDWIKDNGGVCKEDDYPYAGFWPPIKTCATTCDVVEGTEVKEWKQVDPSDEALMEAIADVGPIAIAIEADRMAFQFYKDGVFTAACGTKLDHGVLVVGYGTWNGRTDYWKVKNSWGETWGMDGFILLERAAAQEKEGGECGLLIEAVYPVLGKADPDAALQPPSRAVELDTLVVREEGFQSSAIATDCGDGTSEMVFDDMTITPSSPKRGEPVSMTAKGTLTTPFPSGTYALDVKLGSSSVYKHDGSLCGDTKATLPLGLGTIDIDGFACPSVPGEVTFSLELTLPPIAPPGDYDISLSGSDQSGASALCLDVQLKL